MGGEAGPRRGAGRLVSVIIPVWNRREQIRGAVDSVLHQELPRGWSRELIVVDDGSDDGTADVLDEYRSQIRVVRIPHTGFPGAVRNRGVEYAAGETVAFLDSDDRWLPGKLLRQLPLHEASGTRISHTRERWVRDGTSVSQAGQRHRRRGDIYADALRKCIVGPSTVMIDRTLYHDRGGFREDLEVAEDYEFWLRILRDTPVEYIDEPLTEKRAGDWDQLSTRHNHIEGFRIRALRDLLRSGALVDGGMREAAARRELARKLRIYAAGARRRGRAREADDLVAEAVTWESPDDTANF